MVASGREKKVKIVTEPTFYMNGGFLPQRSPLDVWTYLGISFQGAREEIADVSLPFREALARLTSAPLKPQQRLKLLRVCLLPRYYHRWIVGQTSASTLRGSDVLVRASVRTWLRLPKDVPTGYFHAPIQAGGLGFPLLRVFIPILKSQRLRRLCQSTLPFARAAAETTHVARQLVWCDNLMRVNGVRVTKVAEMWRQCAATLHNSIDGKGIKEASRSKLSTHWVSDGADAIPGAAYVQYHHVRANSLPSRSRTSRGRQQQATSCRAGCPERESPAHCVQRCFRSHGGRILRHNDICRQVAGFLRQKGWRVEAEKAYQTSVGLRRPDLTVSKGGIAAVIDAQIVTSEGELDEAHFRKVAKYETNEDLVDRVGEFTGVPRENVVFAAVTISWRGVWSRSSEREMRWFGLSTRQLLPLTTRTLWGSWMNWKRFNAITSRYNPRLAYRQGA